MVSKAGYVCPRVGRSLFSQLSTSRSCESLLISFNLSYFKASFVRFFFYKLNFWFCGHSFKFGLPTAFEKAKLKREKADALEARKREREDKEKKREELKKIVEEERLKKKEEKERLKIEREKVFSILNVSSKYICMYSCGSYI